MEYYRGFEGLLVRLKHNLIDGRVYTRLVPEPSLIPKMRGVAWGPVEACTTLTNAQSPLQQKRKTNKSKKQYKRIIQRNQENITTI